MNDFPDFKSAADSTSMSFLGITSILRLVVRSCSSRSVGMVNCTGQRDSTVARVVTFGSSRRRKVGPLELRSSDLWAGKMA